MQSFSQKRILYSWPQQSLLWKLSSYYLHSIQVDMWNSFWNINKYMTKSCPSGKSGKRSYSGIGQKLGRRVIHTHHIYMYEHIFFGMLRAQIIRLMLLRWKFEDALPLLAHFQNGCPEENAEKPKIEISVSQNLIITDIHNIPLDICFWGWQIRLY